MTYLAPYGPAERAGLLRQLCRRAANQSADDPPQPHAPARRPLSPPLPGRRKRSSASNGDPPSLYSRCTAGKERSTARFPHRRQTPPSPSDIRPRRGGGRIIPAPRRAPAKAGIRPALLYPLYPLLSGRLPGSSWVTPALQQAWISRLGHTSCPVTLFSSYDKVPDGGVLR